MGNTLMPIIAELADARSHAARAEWLLCCPIAILQKFEGTIRNRLKNAGCEGGIVYLTAFGAVLSATRDPETGLPTIPTQDILFRAGLHLTAWAANRDARDAVPYHTLTDL